MRRQHPLGVTVAAAIAMLGFTMADLPIWWAVAILVTWLLWAACETVIWILELRADRLRYEIRQLIERETTAMREMAARPDAPRSPLVYPRSWQPFINPTIAPGRPTCPR